MFKGSFVALITPFQENGDLDLVALKNLVEWHVESGTEGIVCSGTTGEDPTLSDEEGARVIKTVVETVRKRIPVIAGTGTCITRTTVARTKEALHLGADAALVITPYYNRPTFEGCLAHYTEVGKVGLPIMIYYNPARTGVRLQPEQLASLSHLPHIVGIKDSSGVPDYLDAVKNYTKIDCFSGDDVVALDHLKKGAVGVISIVANIIPAEWKEMVQCSLSGEWTRAKELFDKLLPFAQSLIIETNPQGVKYAAHLLGKCRPNLRLPLVQPRESTRLAIEKALTALSLHADSFQG